jgi:hypothetical protein
MFQQKSRALVLLLLVLSWAPLASAAEETSDGVFAELLNQLAEFLGLTNEAGLVYVPGGLVDEAGPNPSPGGLPLDETGPNWTPGG